MSTHTQGRQEACWQDTSKEEGSRDRSSNGQVGRRHRTQSEVVSASPPDYFFSPAALGRSPPGGRQYTSANHLLNFRYAPRPQVRAEQSLTPEETFPGRSPA